MGFFGFTLIIFPLGITSNSFSKKFRISTLIPIYLALFEYFNLAAETIHLYQVTYIDNIGVEAEYSAVLTYLIGSFK